MRESFVSWPRIAWGIARGSVSSVADHWALAGFSLIAAFGIWFVIEDVENPRVTATFPADGLPASIPVEPVNAGQYIVADSFAVSVVVEGREEDLTNLTAADFTATVDVQGIAPGSPEARDVRVKANRDGVRVIEVRPGAVNVSVVEPAQREMPVTIRRIGQLPAGYVEDEDMTVVEPAFVTITGLPERVAGVQSVDLDVNLSGVTTSPYEVTGTLVARSQSGSTEVVSFDQPRATAVFSIRQTTVQRLLPVIARPSGNPAPGYGIAGIEVEPSSILVTGPTAVMAELQSLTVPRIDQVAGAQADVILTLNVDVPPNTSLERQTVNVIVRIVPVEIGQHLRLPVSFTNIPTGLTPGPQAYYVDVTVTGDGPLITGLELSDVTATVSLTGATAGTSSYPVVITAPPNVTASQPSPIAVTLIAGTP